MSTTTIILLACLGVAIIVLLYLSIRDGKEYKVNMDWCSFKHNPELDYLKQTYELDNIFIDGLCTHGPIEEVLVNSSSYGIQTSKQPCSRMDWKYKGITFHAYLNRFKKVDWVKTSIYSDIMDQKVFDDVERQWEQVESLIKESVEAVNNGTHMKLYGGEAHA